MSGTANSRYACEVEMTGTDEVPATSQTSPVGATLDDSFHQVAQSYLKEVYLPSKGPSVEDIAAEERAVYNLYKKEGTSAAQDTYMTGPTNPFNFVQLLPRPLGRPCVIECSSDKGSWVVGDLKVAPTALETWSVSFDNGHTGIPCISLLLKVAHGQQPKWDNKKDYLELKIAIFTGPQGPKEPAGIKSGFSWTKFDRKDPIVGEMVARTKVQHDVNEDAPVYRINFEYESSFPSGLDRFYERPKHSRIHGQNPAVKQFRHFVQAQGNKTMTLWVKTPIARMETVLRHIGWHVSRQTMPFYPYRLPNGEVESNVENWPMILRLWGGMFAQFDQKHFEQKPGMPVPCLASGAQPVSYREVKEELSFNGRHHYFIRHATSAVREYEYENDCAAALSNSWHDCQVMQYEKMKTQIEGLAQKARHHNFKVGDVGLSLFWISVRLRHADQSTTDYLPAPGTNIKFRWRNGTKEQLRQDDECPYEGTVIDSLGSGQDDFDFVVLARKPKGGRDIKGSRGTEDAPIEQAKLSAATNNASVVRQLNALRILCCDESRSDLGQLRETLFANQWAAIGKAFKPKDKLPKVDVRNTGPNRDNVDFVNIEALEEEMIKCFNLNEEQLGAYRTTMSPSGGLNMLVGPPATGKTLTLSFIAVMLVCFGHKLLLTAASNWATNRIVDDVLAALQRSHDLWQPHLGREVRVIRLHRPTLEFDFIKSQDTWNPKAKSPKDIDLLMTAELATLLEKAAEVNRDVRAQVLGQLNPHYVHKGHSLGQHILDLCKVWEDKETRETVGDELDLCWDEDFEKNPVGPEQDPMDLDDKDPTRRFRQHLNSFKNPAYQMTSEEIKEFAREHLKLARIVLEACDIVITTNNNAGCGLLEDVPFSFVGVDECAQSTEADALIPMVKRGVVARIIAGDEKQLQPTIVSKGFNEGFLQGFLSLFARFCELTFPVQNTLVYQYRMDQEISEFSRLYSYRNELKDAPEVVGRHRPLNLAVKEVIKQHYGITDHAVLLLSPESGSHEVELNGSSLFNRANASSVQTFVRNLLSHDGIKVSDITYLTYYQAQKKFLRRHINDMGVDTDPSTGMGIKTVDSSQGSEKGIVIIDFVLAADVGEKGKQFSVSTFVRSFNRLNVALSRAMDGLILIADARMLRESGKYYHSNPKFLDKYVDWPLPALYDWANGNGTIKTDHSSQVPKRPRSPSPEEVHLSMREQIRRSKAAGGSSKQSRPYNPQTKQQGQQQQRRRRQQEEQLRPRQQPQQQPQQQPPQSQPPQPPQPLGQMDLTALMTMSDEELAELLQWRRQQQAMLQQQAAPQQAALQQASPPHVSPQQQSSSHPYGGWMPPSAQNSQK